MCYVPPTASPSAAIASANSSPRSSGGVTSGRSPTAGIFLMQSFNKNFQLEIIKALGLICMLQGFKICHADVDISMYRQIQTYLILIISSLTSAKKTWKQWQPCLVTFNHDTNQRWNISVKLFIHDMMQI